MAAHGTRKNDAKLDAFAAKLAEGMSAPEAARAVGYEGSSIASNARRRAQNPAVKAKVAELRREAARNTVVTIQSLIDNAEEARILAMDIWQPSAANSCIQTLAKLTGNWLDRSEFTGKDGTPLVPEYTDEQRARALAMFLAKNAKAVAEASA
jgi:hypothetical protein